MGSYYICGHQKRPSLLDDVDDDSADKDLDDEDNDLVFVAAWSTRSPIGRLSRSALAFLFSTISPLYLSS